MRLPRTLTAAAFLAASSCAFAQTLKPGLWEITNNMRSGSGQMEQSMAQVQQQMAGLPPEQRKMMQEMMAKQGVSMGAGGTGAMSVRICVTREMAERNDIPTQQGDCRYGAALRSGNTVKSSFSCTNPPSSGEGSVTILSPEAYTTKMTMNTVTHGKAETVDMDGSGKWLSADCGAIKPMAMPRK